VTPVIAVVTGVLFLNEPLTTRVLVGGALVIAGVAFTAKSRY
jgi:drug/metabolite transporter (DMT)-like permease